MYVMANAFKCIFHKFKSIALEKTDIILYNCAKFHFTHGYVFIPSM